MIDLEEGEKIVFEIRRHWYIFVIETISLVFMLMIPVVVLGVLDILGDGFGMKTGALFIFLSAGWTFIVWLSFFVIWMDFHLDVWIVTDRRIIDIEQYSLFSRDISEFRLDRVQDITVEVKGILPTLLHFGDLHVQTAGEARRFIIKNIPEPYHVKDQIVRAQASAVMQVRGGNTGY